MACRVLAGSERELVLAGLVVISAVGGDDALRCSGCPGVVDEHASPYA